MRQFVPATLTIIALLAGCTPPAKEEIKLQYPASRKGDVVDDYHGTKVPDPYRWLEESDTDETKAWIIEQNRLTSSYLESIDKRESVRQRLTELWSYERFSSPVTEGGRYFYTYNSGEQDHDQLMIAEKLDGEPRLLLDPDTFSEDGTVGLAGWKVSPDGRLLAYGITSGGSDWREWKIRDIETGQDLPDHLQWLKFTSAYWTVDSSGFYYTRFDEPQSGKELQGTNSFNKVYFHRVNTSQDEDLLVYERPDKKDWLFNARQSEDGRYLVVTVMHGTDSHNMLLYKDLSSTSPEMVTLIDGFEESYYYLGNDGSSFYLQTTDQAPRGRIIAIDVDRPERSAWQEIVPEQDQSLEFARIVGNTIIASYLKDAYSQVQLFALDGSSRCAVELPGIGTAVGFRGNRRSTETFYSFSSFAAPGAIYHLDLTTARSTVFRQPDIKLDSDAFVTEQVFYSSKDSTRIPMFISYRRGIQLDGSTPTILYGYGGFNISMTPFFSVANAVWLEMGGIFAVANIRGGSEYGEAWHQQGMLEHKQNCFDDFIAAAEWLIDNRYTSSERLAISGGSNGGTLVGAVLNQRPDLFAAAVPWSGVMDMLRFQRFTIGWAWVSDYGSPDDPEMFPVLHSYSPLHNISPGTEYPAVLVMTTDHDDRVVPAHSLKYIATLQAAQNGPEPVLIRIATRMGHGSGSPVSKRIDVYTDELAFLVHELQL
jgi:prolyl oligopeptidase